MLKPLLRIALILLIPVMIGGGTFAFLRNAFLVPRDREANQPHLIEVASGKSFRQLCKELEDKGLLKYWWSLEILSRLSRQDTKIKAGEYEVSPSMTPKEILAKLTSEDTFKRIVTLKEGVSIWEVGKLVQDAGLLPEPDFTSALTDGALLKAAGLLAPSFEGYLFPQTYHFSRPITPKSIIWRMLEEGEKHWPEEFSKKADEYNLSRHEVLTLASIIEKESGNVEEQPIISSVFHNRLNRAMRLQSDPTVIYGIPNFDGNLTREHLQTNHPYNTYTNLGLPPGPICNPGLSAIRAALFPADTQYIFFVGNGSGRHIFSTTLAEHNEAVNKYQRNRK